MLKKFMLKISTYEIQEKNIGIIMSKIEERLGKEEYNKKMLYSSMKIRLILQQMIDREKDKDRMIDNYYCGEVRYVNVMNTVYLKGGVMVDFLIDRKNAKITDLDYSVNVEKENKEIKEKLKNLEYQKKICSEIEKELRWLYNEIEKLNWEEIKDEIYDKEYEKIEIYNAYDENKPTIEYIKNQSKIKKPNRYIKMYKTEIDDRLDLARYYYSEIIEDENKKTEIKICIVDFSVEYVKHPEMSCLLAQRWITEKIYTISQSTISMLNDQLKALLYSAVKMGFKYEKRKKRVIGILLELTNEEIRKSKINIDKYKMKKEISDEPFDIIYLARYICKKEINLKDWIIRKREEEHITEESSRKYVCEMIEDVWPKVERRLSR